MPQKSDDLRADSDFTIANAPPMTAPLTLALTGAHEASARSARKRVSVRVEQPVRPDYHYAPPGQFARVNAIRELRSIVKPPILIVNFPTKVSSHNMTVFRTRPLASSQMAP